MTALKAIRQKCLECSCGNPNEVRACPITRCALYAFRMGKNPNIRPLTEEQKKKKLENLKPKP